ncbi:delta-60 repeat domain-containing protein [Trichlorobacter thiogenes]|uniref:Delta-60 repeat domain-containing protein n=1 Tax=Trichlorobacter thiogenes TaxID=115783 RepID=A0A1T4PAQ4_9BACT|nr:delta-60 repeat domain-containing protein [Trichlorobacter thiogenes]SJZ88633.1 delta-60 repeat domain-containing protein [Trichlorobacter thiogenes]
MATRSIPSKLIMLCALMVCIISCVTQAAATVTLDAGFTPVLATAGRITGIVPLANSKVLVIGNFSSISGVARKNIARLNADGSVDSGFQLDSRIPADMIYAAAVQADGKILIGGQITVYGETESQNYLFRLNSDGSWDTTFKAGGYIFGNPGTTYGLDNVVRSIAVDSNGKILVGGDFATPRSHIARLNTDGSEDTSFNPGSGADGTVTHIALQSTGHIIIGGGFENVNGTAKAKVARLYPDGTLYGDAFGTGLAGGGLSALALQQSGDMVLLGGTFNSLNGQTVPKLIRTTAVGTLDASFTQTYNPDTGSKVGDQLQAITSLVAVGSPATKIIVGGWYTFTIFGGYPTEHNARIYILDAANGTYVNSVPFKGKPTDVWALAQRSDGLAVAGGSFTQLDDATDVYFYGLCQLDPANYYRPFESFKPIVGGQADVRTMALQGDGKLIVGGDFFLANGTPKNGVARFSTSGTLDTTLSVPATEGGIVTGLLVRSDGKLVMGGSFYNIADQTYKDVALMSTTGTLEASAYAGGVSALALNQGDKVLTALYHTPGIKGLTADLMVDSSFVPGSGIPNSQTEYVNTVVVQSDGKILVGGAFSSFSGVACQNIVRLNSNGSIDNTFVPPAFTVFYGLSEVYAIALQPDGKILLAGRFSTVGGVDSPTVVRLNSNGSVDSSFITPFGNSGSTVYALALQPDGRILVGGSMQIVEGENIYNSLVRLHPNGSRDSTFNSSVTGIVKSIVTDGIQLLVGGTIEAVDGSARQGLVRFTTTPEYLLTVTRSSVAGGNITASTGTLGWSGTVGMAAYNSGTSVTLTAQAGSGYIFSGWSGGGCSGTGSCIVTMSAARTVTASFTAVPQETLTVNLSGSGAGSVISTPVGIDCPAASCSGQFTSGSTVTLTAVPNASSALVGWIGCQTTNGTVCGVIMNVPREVTAVFDSAKAQIGTTRYASLAEAFATNFGTTPILLLAGNLGESLTVTKSATLKGGYDAHFTWLPDSFTIMNAPLTVKAGTLTVDRITVK